MTSSTKPKCRSNQWSVDKPSGQRFHKPTLHSPLDINQFEDACTEKSDDRGVHTQCPFSAKVDPVAGLAEMVQSDVSPEGVTSAPVTPGSRQPFIDQGKFLNCEEGALQDENLYGESHGLITDLRSQPEMFPPQPQKVTGPTSNSGPIMKTEGCKEENYPSQAQSSKGSPALPPKVYVRQRYGKSKAGPLQTVIEEDSMSMEDGGLGALINSPCQGPNNLITEKNDGLRYNSDINSEVMEEAKQQWQLATTIGLQSTADQHECIQSFATMESRDRKEAVKMGNKNIQR